jgi:tetratricopeptide (TPR) repeat protein
MRLGLHLPLAIMLSAAASTPQAALAKDKLPQRVEAPEVAFEQLIDRYYEFLSERRLDAAEETVATIRKAAGDRVAGEAIASMMSSPIAAARQKDSEARRLLSKGEAALPNTPETLSLILPAYFVVDRPDFAGLVIDRMIARAPDVARELPTEWVYATLRDSGEAPETVENRRIGLAELGFGGAQGDYMTTAAIGILMKRGEVERAKSLLHHVDAPRAVENLLIQRRFAPLWPALTEQAGPKLAESRQSTVRHALQTYSDKPNDNEALADLISAYRYASRYSDAIELGNKVPTSAADFAAADEQMGWAVNNLALALHNSGQAEEADQLFASLNEALPTNVWRVNMFINRVELLVQDGKFESAMPLIAAAEKEPKSPYAEQLLRRLRYCALSRLDRKAEAAALRPTVIAKAKDALAATIEGFLCTGELDEAERLALQYLDDLDFQEDFVRSLQRIPLTADDPSVWGRWTALRERSAIAAAFDKLGRDLPDELRAEGTGKVQ